MDKTKILNVSVSTKKKIATINRYDETIYNAVENLKVKEKYNLDNNESNLSQNTVHDLKQFLHFAWAVPNNFSEFATHTIGYIAGYVVRKLSVKCAECITGCKVLSVTCKNNPVKSQNAIALIIAKSRGGLIVPSESVINICTVAEQLFRKAYNCNMGKPPIEANFPAVLANAAYKKLLLSKTKLFPELEEHFHETFMSDTCINHKYILIKHILMHYIEIRMYAASKNLALSITGTNIRHFLTRQIVWAHQ